MTETRRNFGGALVLGGAGALVALLGWLAFVFVARSQGAAAYADFSVVWSVYFAIAGVLIGLQQETTRSLMIFHRAQERSRLLGACALVAGSVGVVALTILAAAALFTRAQIGDIGNVAGATLVALPVLAAAMVVNGVLTAQGRWAALAVVMILDQAVRLLAVLVVIQVSPNAPGYGIALVAGLVCYVPFMVGGFRHSVIAGRRWGFVSRSWAAMVSNGCANVLVVGLPALITVTGDGSDRARGVLFAAVVLTRTPILLVANSVRPVVVRMLVTRRDVLGETSRRLLPTVMLAGLAAVAIGWVAGPWLLRVLFGHSFEVSNGLMGGLVFAALLILVQTWTGIALVVLDRDLSSTVGWLLAVVASIGCLTLPLDLAERTLTAVLLGPVLGIGAHTVALIPALRDVRPDAGPVDVGSDASA